MTDKTDTTIIENTDTIPAALPNKSNGQLSQSEQQFLSIKSTTLKRGLTPRNTLDLKHDKEGSKKFIDEVNKSGIDYENQQSREIMSYRHSDQSKSLVSKSCIN